MPLDDFDQKLELLHAEQMAFLRHASPDDWHRYAWHHNWDDRLDGLFWIVSQPDCDKATALLIFWLGEPACYDYETEEEKMGDDIYAVAPMLRHIAERFNTSGFHRSEIAYDFLRDHGCNMPEYAPTGRADIDRLVERQKDIDNPKIKLHPDLKLLHIQGRRVGDYCDEDFFERFPDDVDDLEIDADQGTATSQPYTKTYQANDTHSEAAARIRALRQNFGGDANVATSDDRLRATGYVSQQSNNVIEEDRFWIPGFAAGNACAVAIIAGALTYYSSGTLQQPSLFIGLCVAGLFYCLVKMITELRDWNKKCASEGIPPDESGRTIGWAVLPAFLIGGPMGYSAAATNLIGQGGLGSRIILALAGITMILLCSLLAVWIARRLGSGQHFARN